MTIIQRVSRGIKYNTASKVGGSLLQFLYITVLIRELGPFLYGIYSLMFSFMATAGTLSSLGLDRTLLRFVPELQATGRVEETKKIFSWLLEQRLLIAGIASSALFLTAEGIATFYARPELAVLIRRFCPILVLWVFTTAVRALLEGFYQQPFLCVVGLLTSMTNVLFLWFFLSFQYALVGVIYAQIIATVFGVALMGVRTGSFFSFQTGVDFDRGLWLRVKRYTAIMVADDIMSSLLTPLSIIILGAFVSPEDVGYFNLAMGLSSSLLTLVVSLVGNLNVVSLSELSSKNPSRLSMGCSAYLRLIYFLAIPSAFGCAVLSNSILKVAFGVAMSPASFLLSLLVWPVCISLSVSVTGNVLLVQEKLGLYLKLGLLLTTVTIASNLIFVPWYGALGAVITTSWTYIAGSLVYAYFAKKHIGSFVPYRFLGKCFLAAVFMTPIALIVEAIGVNDLLALSLTVLAGGFAYGIGTRFLRVLEEADRLIVLSSALPFKRVIAKVLFHA